MKTTSSKPFMAKSILQLVIVTVFFFVVGHSQDLKQMSPNELLSKGTEFMKNKKQWRKAELYLYAYLQLNTQYYRENPDLQKELQRSLIELAQANTGAGAYAKADGPDAPKKSIPNTLKNYEDNSTGGRSLTASPPTPGGVAKSIKTGTYTCNDQGTYYINCIGEKVWWFGKADNGGFTNVFYGTIANDIIRGQWADVPIGKADSHGTIELQIKSTNEFIAKSQTGGFGGGSWKLKNNITKDVSSEYIKQ